MASAKTSKQVLERKHVRETGTEPGKGAEQAQRQEYGARSSVQVSSPQFGRPDLRSRSIRNWQRARLHADFGFMLPLRISLKTGHTADLVRLQETTRMGWR